MSNLIDLHETACYFVRADIIDDLTIELTYPSNILIENPIQQSVVRYTLGDGTVTKTEFSDGRVIDEITFRSPDYAKRLIIMADVMAYCEALGISKELIFKYKDGIRLSEEEGVIDHLQRPVDRYLEVVLFSVFTSTHTRKDGAQIAAANGVEEGYNILLTILEMRGL